MHLTPFVSWRHCAHGKLRCAQGNERRDWRKVRPLHTVQPGTPLTTALGMLLEAGVSVLPVVDEARPWQSWRMSRPA